MAKVTIHNLKLKDFAESFGTTVNDMPLDCRKLIRNSDFRYKILSIHERDSVILEVLRKIESDQQKIGVPERRAVWNKGWEGNLKDFVGSGYKLEKLTPKFIRPNQPIRLKGDYIVPLNPGFELDYLSVFRLWLFQKYFKSFDNIYEFGCGTGFNLVVLALLYPDKNLIGSDFVVSSREIINNIAKAHNFKIDGLLFDMIKPDNNFVIGPNSAVYTFGAVEQLAGKFEAFLQFLLNKSPKICVHIEPTIELYDETKLPDYLAIKFHKKRGYTTGFLPRLQELEKENKIELIKVKRLYFGSLFMEGYSLIIWKPKRRA